MANKQTKHLANLPSPLSTKTHHGVNFTGEHNGGAVKAGALTFQRREVYKSFCICSSRERERSGRNPWRGHGNPLNRPEMSMINQRIICERPRLARHMDLV